MYTTMNNENKNSLKSTPLQKWKVRLLGIPMVFVASSVIFGYSVYKD